MNQFMRRLAADDPRQLVLAGAIAACTLVTGTAMFLSFFTMAGGEAGGLLFATLFTALVTTALTLCLHGVVETRRGQGRGIWLVGYLLCLAVSVTISFGSFFQLLSSTGLAQDSARQAVGKLVQPLNQFELSYGELADTATGLASYSEAQAKAEFDRGGTCGGPAIPEDGPRRRLRQADAATFAEYARHFESRRDKVRLVVGDLRKVASGYAPARHQEALDAAESAFSYATALAHDPRLKTWNETLKARISRSSSEMVETSTGIRFACPDAHLTALMQTAGAVALPGLPRAAPHIETPVLSSSVKRGFSLLLFQTPFDPQRDGPPLGLALVVDLLLMIFVTARHRRATQLSLLAEGALDGRRDAARALRRVLEGPSRLAELAESLVEGLADGGRWSLISLLEANAVTVGVNSFLVVPQGRRGSRLRRLARVLEAADLASLHHSAPVARLRPRWRTGLGAAVEGVVLVDVYRLKKAALAELIVDALRSRDVNTPASPPTAANAEGGAQEGWRSFRDLGGGRAN